VFGQFRQQVQSGIDGW